MEATGIQETYMSSDTEHSQKEVNTPQPTRFRMTHPRRVILDCLKQAAVYMTADDIFIALHPDDPGIGLATIYRTLNLLEEHEMISKVNVGDGRARFAYIERAPNSNNYHQLVCKRCFKIIKFNDFSYEEVLCMRQCEKKYSEIYHFAIESHVVQYYGLCEECQKADAREHDQASV